MAMCSSQSCEALVAVECLDPGQEACLADDNGNIGNNNIGTGNFGNGNVGYKNVGELLVGDAQPPASTVLGPARGCGRATTWPCQSRNPETHARPPPCRPAGSYNVGNQNWGNANTGVFLTCNGATGMPSTCEAEQLETSNTVDVTLPPPSPPVQPSIVLRAAYCSQADVDVVLCNGFVTVEPMPDEGSTVTLTYYLDGEVFEDTVEPTSGDFSQMSLFNSTSAYGSASASVDWSGGIDAVTSDNVTIHTNPVVITAASCAGPVDGSVTCTTSVAFTVAAATGDSPLIVEYTLGGVEFHDSWKPTGHNTTHASTFNATTTTGTAQVLFVSPTENYYPSPLVDV